MPTLFRFLRFVIIVAVLVAAALWSLANLVRPARRPMTEPLPASRLAGPPAAALPAAPESAAPAASDRPAGGAP